MFIFYLRLPKLIGEEMKLCEILTTENIKVPLESKEKYKCIEELVDLLVSNGKVKDKDAFLNTIIEREQTRTTGIGYGLAIPHGKSDAVDSLVIAIGKPAEPIDFKSIDGKPVFFIVLMGSPVDQAGPHIQALARISRLMTTPSFREQIQKAQTPREILQAFIDHEM